MTEQVEVSLALAIVELAGAAQRLEGAERARNATDNGVTSAIIVVNSGLARAAAPLVRYVLVVAHPCVV